jgi:predicted nucleic acid-binding protein
MTVFVDTSAFYAMLDRDDSNHPGAKAEWTRLLGTNTVLATSNYVLLETSALIQHRLGLKAVHDFQEDVVPLLQVDWIDEERHNAGIEAVLAAGRRRLSLVDCTSFRSARKCGARAVFCFDVHFQEQGFEALPRSPSPHQP